MADRIEKEPFHEMTVVDSIATDGCGIRCSCGMFFQKFNDPIEPQQLWLLHFNEMVLRDCREREIAIFNERMRPKGIITFDPPSSILRRMLQRFVG